MSLSLRRYDNVIRPAYEAIAAVGWSVAALSMMIVVLITDLPTAAFTYMAGISSLLASWRWYQTFRLWDFKIAMAGQSFVLMKQRMLRKLMAAKPEHLWMGFGFNWEPVHTQRAIEIRKGSEKNLLPPAWYRNLKGFEHDNTKAVGKPWIHGIGADEEKQVYVPLPTIEGHNLIFGTTGSGKTRLYESLITQAVWRNEVVIIIDPKGDHELADIAEQACISAGAGERFLKFHPAFPSQSIRLDPLKNWNNATELASRIAALMESDDSFKQMAWKAVYVVSEAMIYCDSMPNLMRIRRYIENGPEPLMEQVLRTYFDRNIPRWEGLLSDLVSKAQNGKLPSKIPGSPKLIAYIHFYKNEVAEEQRDGTVDGLLAMVEHSREHLSKILANLVPLLAQLTAGELGRMLSPDRNDIDDERAIFDTGKIVRGKHVLYLGLDSLPNATVGSALGSIFLADLVTVAGEIYNYGDGKGPKIQLLVDEASEVVNQPLIQILNKARGAGFVTTLAAQTLPDFQARLGDESKALQLLGNCNNLIALRTKCRKTQEYIVEMFGKTHVQSISRSHMAGHRSVDAGADYTGNVGQSMSETETDVFPPELLGMLPNLHYIAFMAGGRLIKGRYPKLIAEHD